MTISAKDVEEIQKLLDGSAFSELSLEIGDLKLHLRRAGAAPRDAVARTAKAVTAEVAPATAKAAPPEPGVVDVPSPLLGVYYRAPKPGEAPYVDVGDEVEEDTIIGIVEVMKLMNTVRAGVRGAVTEILGENGKLVEYGQTLVRVRTR